MKVAYSPISEDFSHPEDRRRVCFYFNEKKVNLIKANLFEDYDLVFLSTLADIEGWRIYKLKKKTKIIFNLTDAYLSANKYGFKNLFRGPFRYLTGHSSRFRFSYQNSLKDLLSTADAVTCGSPEAMKNLRHFNSNVHVVQDYFWKDIRSKKESYLIAQGELNILWQGLSHGNLEIFMMLREILSSLKGLKVNLHVISAQTYCKFGSAYICQPTSQLVENIFNYSDVKTYFYSWHSTTFSSIAGSCDLALIPIPSNDFMMWEKPENKLIELWSIGLPVLTSPTPAYSRVMLKAGIDGTCKNVHEWQQKIIDLISSTEKRGDYMKLAANLVERDYSKEKIISQWDTLLNSISINPNTISTGPCIHEY